MAINHKILHPLQYVTLIQIWVFLYILLIQVVKECSIRQLIAFLGVLIILRVHLEAVIRQMDKLVHLRQRVLV